VNLDERVARGGVEYVSGRYRDASERELLELQQAIYNSPNPTRRWMHNVRKDWVTNQLALHRRQDGSALEIGPGCGIYIPTLVVNFGSVTVSDIEEAYLSSAREFRAPAGGQLHVIVDNIADSRLSNEAFDVVLCSEVIEHLPRADLTLAALRGMARVLKPGGVLILSTPQSFSTVEIMGRVAFHPRVIGAVRRLYRGEPVLPPGHTNLQTVGNLRMAIEAAGFRVKTLDRFALYLPGLAEFGGVMGKRVAEALAQLIRHVPLLRGLLWTQAWVLERT
jgi:SAM-dependent methyltransferase